LDGAVLRKLSDRVTECLTRAADAERRAREAVDPAARDDFLDMARRWSALAQSMQYVESVDEFLLDQRRNRPRGRSEP